MTVPEQRRTSGDATEHIEPYLDLGGDTQGAHPIDELSDDSVIALAHAGLGGEHIRRQAVSLEQRHAHELTDEQRATNERHLAEIFAEYGWRRKSKPIT